MAEKSRQTKAKAPPPMVREAAVAYETRSLAEVFWIAFKSLSTEAQEAFLDHLLNDPDWYDEIADSVAAIEAQGEPSRPFEEFVEELRREGQLSGIALTYGGRRKET